MVYRGRIIQEARINADGTVTEADGDAGGDANGNSNGDSQENGDSQASTQRNDPQNAWVKAVFEDDAEQTHEWQRTITSSGSSEYRINNRVVTQKQYGEALEEHSILVKARNFLVFQGDVEKLATTAPEQLTLQVERISGSLEQKAEYDRLKEESEAATEDNAKHLHERRGINGELKTYQEQKAEADEYEKKLAERDEAIVTKNLWKLYLDQQVMEKARNKIASHQEELKEHKRSVEKYHQRHEAERQAEAKIRRDLTKTDRNTKAKEKEIEDASNELAPIEEKIRLSNETRRKYESRLDELRKKRDAEKKAVEKCQKDLDLVQKAEKKWEDDFKAAAQNQGRELSEQDLQEYGRLRSDVTKRTHGDQMQIDKLKREVETDRDQVKNLQQSVDSHEKAIEKLSADISKLEERQQASKTQIRDLESARAAKQQELDRLQADRKQIEMQYYEKNQLLQEVLKQLSIVEGSRRESRKQQEARRTIDRLKTRFGSEKVHGRYKDLITPKMQKYRKAIGRVLGHQMDTVIVDTEATAKSCIEYLKAERIGVMSFNPLDSIQIQAVDPQLKGMHEGMRLAIDCINYEPKHERAMTAACGNTMICNTEKLAKELRYQRRIEVKAVTLDGRVIGKGGTQTGGELDRDDDSSEQQWDERSYQALLDKKNRYEEELRALPKQDRQYTQEQALQVELLDLEEQITRAKEEARALGRNIESLKKELAHHKSELKGVRPNYEKQAQRVQNREAELESYQDSVNQVNDQVFAAFCQRLGYESIRDYEAQQGTVQQEAAEKRLEFSKQRSRLQYLMKQVDSSHRGVEERLKQAEEEIKRKTADITELEAKREELQSARDVLQAELETLQDQRTRLEQKLAERVAAVKEARRTLDQRNEKVKNVLKEVDEEDAKIKSSATNRYNVLKECRVNEIKIPLTEDSKPLTSLPMTDMPRPDADAMDVDEDPDSTQIQPAEVDDYGIDVDFDELDEELKTEIVEILETEDEQDDRVQSQKLKAAESKLTDVIANLETDINKATPNMRAAERLAATETRLKAIDEAFAETRKRAAAAKKAFEEVKTKRYDLFMKAFNHISENIGGTYKDLTKSPQFPLGGQAYLDMEDSTEPYLAGLKYHAMPPLKRFRDMEHLSGGEKTIAALALLFAIHSYQPSPFFVLDEVDAALDNVNVSRVAKYVREHASPGMQFIVISLKAGFFQESETLVGVMRDQADQQKKVFLSSADQTLVITTYGTIGTDLHALSSTSWIATGYFLTLSAFQPLYGKLSDIFGRKQCLLSAYLIFGIGSVGCGLARNIGELVAARAFAGVGGGGMSVCTSILLSDIVSLRERGQWQGYVNLVYAFGASAGAPLGGLLADSIGWRWAFLAQGPMCAMAFIAVALVLELPKQDQSHWKEKVKRIDFLGAVILIFAVFGLLIGLDRGSNVSWNNPITIAGLASTPLFIVFVLVEKYVATHPFAPGRIILNKTLFACYLCNFFSFGGWLAALFFIPLYWQVMGDYSASKAGLFLVPSIILGVSGSLFSGFYMRRTAKYYWITVIAYTNLTIGLSLILLFAGLIMESLPAMVVATCVCSFSNGIGVTTTLIGLIANASHTDQAVATACSYLFRSLGSVFGVSMCATAFNQTLRRSLQEKLQGDDAAEIAERVRAGLAYYKGLDPALKSIVKECYGQATRAALYVGIVLVAGSAIFAWFIKEKSLEDNKSRSADPEIAEE
ncbi:Structural maintenance of chromosomes protein 1 [Alternaria alternata]|nr:Structural maintenance of chromosomes protein 1 [Alternaria alternata]